VILGHELAAEVMSGPHAGRIAAVSQGNSCGSCERCTDGLEHFCTSATGLGAVRFGGVLGGLGEYVTAPAERVMPAPDGADPALLSLAEPLAVSMRSLDHSEVGEARWAVVLGCGPIGLMSIIVARAAGAQHIVAVEARPQRAALARAMGADVVLEPSDEVRREVRRLTGIGADVVIEAAGVPATVALAGALARPGGHVFLQGIPHDPVAIVIAQWTLKEITVHTSVGQSLDQHRQAMEFIVTRTDVPFDRFITRRASLDEAPEVFEAMNAGADEIKVVVETCR
jgi:threonine dehydrogenase-like Zn-dependent dehydrogenase